MSDDLDLETGKPVNGDNGEPVKRKRGRPRGSTTRRPKVETEIESRLERLLGRIADLRDGRDDPELATAIREDSQAIAGAIRDVTKLLGAPARRVVLALLAVVEPAIAFARIGRILGGRLADRRARILAERDGGAYDPADEYAPIVEEHAQEPQPVG